MKAGRTLVLLLLLLLPVEGAAKSVIYLIPGIVQLKRGQTLKGVLLISAFSLCVGAAIWKDHEGYQYYLKYKRATTVEEVLRYRELAERSFRERNYLAAAAGAVWLLHVLDLSFSRRMQLNVQLGKGFCSFGLNYNF